METTLHPVKRFFKLLELDRKDIVYIYLYAVFAGIIALSLPLGIQAVIGLIAGGAISVSLIVLIAAVTIATTLSGVLKIMQLSVTETIQRRIFARSAFDFSFRLPRLRLDILENKYPPELVNRFFDTLTLQKGLPKILMDFSTALLQILFGLLLIAFYHPFFVFFGIGLIFILGLIFWYTGPGGLQTSLNESKYKYHIAHWLEEVARNMTTFKLAGSTTYHLEKTDDLVCGYLDSRKKHFRILLFQYGNIVAFKTIITAALLALGSYLVINNQINIGQFVAAEIVVILVLNSVEKLILSMETIYDVLTALEKLGNVTDLAIESNEGIDFGEIDLSSGMELQTQELRFQFNDADRPTIDGLNMHIKPGERVCIAGYNGAGKSTLLKLVAGLYTNYTGSLSYNGFSGRSLKIETLRDFIGDFNSDEDIFAGTILENITVGNKDIGLTQLQRTIREVGLQSYVQQLSQGLNTALLPEGRNVPGSIRTRILLARSIARQPRLLALEGFLHNLAKQEQEEVIQLLTDRKKPWTLILVSDLPEVAQQCDRTLIMKDGKLVEEGVYEKIRHCIHYEQVFKKSNDLLV